MTRDEKTYPDAETFNPARWIEPAYPTFKEPLTQYPNLNGYSQFGFGRRTCQGIAIVEQDLFLTMGGMAWAFDITKKCRADGSEIDVHWDDFSPLLIAKPAPFEFDASPRSESVKRELSKMWERGKGDDDMQNERQEANTGVTKMSAQDDYEEAQWVGGSDTSESSDGGSEISTSQSIE